MNEDIIFNIIKDCTKIFNEIKKKKNADLNTSLDNCLNNLNTLKENISQKNEEKAKEYLLSISISFIEGAKQIINLKYTKFFFNILTLTKKFVEYGLFSKEKSSNLIEILKDIYNNSKINDECQNKVIEILQTLIFTFFCEIKYDILSNIYIIILKSFNNTSNSKNKDFKNPIRILFTTITERVFQSNNLEVIIQITILIFSWYNLSLKKKIQTLNRRNSKDTNSEQKEKKNEIDNIINDKSSNNEISDDIDDNIKNEIITILNQKKNNVYIQCLSLELLSQGFLIIHNKSKSQKQDQYDLNFLKLFIKEKILKSLAISIENIKTNNSSSEEELNYLHYLKIIKIVKIIIFNYKVNYDIIDKILELLTEKNKDNKISWKNNLSFEFLVNIIMDYKLLEKIGKWKKEIISTMFSCLANFIDNLEVLKDEKENKKSENFISNFMKKKEFENNKIYIEGDEIVIFKEQQKKYYTNHINECIQNIIDYLIKDKNIQKKNEDNKNLTDEEILEKEIFGVISSNLKEIIFKLLKNEMNKHTNIQNESNYDLKEYVNYVKNMIEIFNNLKMFEKRDEYLQYLCELCLMFPEGKNKNDDDKNIFLALTLIDFMKTPKLMKKEIFVKVLQTIEVFNHKYNNLKLSEYAKSDLDRIIKDINILYEKYNSPEKGEEKVNKEVKQIEEKEEEKDKKEKEENEHKKNELKNNLCEKIDSLFIDINNMSLEEVKFIYESLSSCIDLAIEKNIKNKNEYEVKKEEKEKEKDQDTSKSNTNKETKLISKNSTLNNDEEDIFIYEIIFYYSKILTITLFNVDHIYILFDPFVDVINKLLDNKIIVDFSIEILCSLIPEILLKYEKIEKNVNKNINEENKIWINEKWQKVLFSPLLTILSQVELYELIKGKIFIGLNKIIQQSGHYIDLFGWESIIQSCSILSNYDVENSFLPVKQILNDYNIYLTLFNIIPIMKILHIFISNKTDKNISFSSVELFWSCANIIDDYKQGKRVINKKQKTIFESLLKEKELNVYCDEIYIKLFSNLISINKDERIEVRKSGLNVFTEIFASKMNSIEAENCLKIIKDIFFKVFSDNAEKFVADNKNNELEQTLQTSLLDIIKIFKEYFKENEEGKNIFDNYLNKIIEIIPFGSTPLNTDILKSIIEIKINKNENVPMIITKMGVFFKILLLVNDFINNPNFKVTQLNKVPAYKLFNAVLTYISSIYLDSNHIEIFTDDNFKNIFTIIDTLFQKIYTIEPKLLEIKPRKVIEFENEIFNFLEKIPIQNYCLFNYLLDKMNLDTKVPHTDAIYRRSLECFENIIWKNKNGNKFGLKKEECDIIKKLIKKIEQIINLLNNNEAVESLIKISSSENPEKEEESEKNINLQDYLSYFIKIIDGICNNFMKYKEKEDNDEIKEEKEEIINNINEFFLLLLELFENIFNQNNIYNEAIDKSYLPILNEIKKELEIKSVSFIINKLISYILFILGDEDEKIFKKIEEKIINIIKLSCDTPSKIRDTNLSLVSLDQICLNELFKICAYKSSEEIINNIANKKNINLDKYIENQIKISKICSNLLISKIIEILKKFREDEIKSGDMPLTRVRIQEIIDLLKNAKELEMFPNFNIIDSNEKNEIKKEEMTVFDVVSKTKKIHLFYLQPILTDFIDTKEKDIKNLVKDIFIEINNIMGMPKLNTLNK